jgi:acyl dehydratase
VALDASLVGCEAGSVEVVADARWVMGYAAGVPDHRRSCFDTSGTLDVHPMFPVAPEWRLLTSMRVVPTAMSPAEVLRGVHAGHDVIIERPIPVGATLVVSARVVAVERRRAGAQQQVLFTATADDGAVVWRTLMTSIFLGVELDGPAASVGTGWPDAPQPLGPTELDWVSRSSHVTAIDAHVYSECARIWNPIHTDVAVARTVGLAQPVLHGTATMARAVSLCTEALGMPLRDVGRVGGDFAAMVELDSMIDVRFVDGDTIHFEVVNAAGQLAIRSGFIQRR